VTTARPDEDAMLARAIQWSLALALPALPAAAAQDLPDELNLQCEGTMSAVLEAASPITRNQTFRINLRLKDGTMVDTATGLVEGTGCVLEGELIKCEVTRQYPIARFNALVKRSSSVVLNRKTGEVTLLVESWDYPENSDRHTAHMRAMRTGICRSNALF
jgi:hypothetical protein